MASQGPSRGLRRLSRPVRHSEPGSVTRNSALGTQIALRPARGTPVLRTEATKASRRRARQCGDPVQPGRAGDLQTGWQMRSSGADSEQARSSANPRSARRRRQAHSPRQLYNAADKVAVICNNRAGEATADGRRDRPPHMLNAMRRSLRHLTLRHMRRIVRIDDKVISATKASKHRFGIYRDSFGRSYITALRFVARRMR